jgi:hypothetical protein
MALTVLVACINFVSGCDAVYRDVSNELSHKERIGQTCMVVASLHAHGVANKLEGDRKTDYVTIWNPGFAGPEVTFIAVIEPGAKIKVLKARKCGNCPFDERVDFQVQVNPEPAAFAGRPAYLRAESYSPQYLRCSGDGSA